MTAYACKAHECTMPGAIFPSGGSGGGVCRFHYGAVPSAWPHITDVLKDWGCVAFEANECRRVLTGAETMVDVKAQNAALAKGWERLSLQVQNSGWASDLKPAANEQLASWGARLERFLQQRVVSAVNQVPA